VRSWILRHRLRLRLIYGPGPEPATLEALGPAASESVAGAEPGALHDATGARVPGRLRRSEEGLELVPMPRRVGPGRQVG